MISTQHCDKMVVKKGEEWNLSEVTARLTSDEVSLRVADGKGWNIIFDKEPTKVSLYSCSSIFIYEYAFLHDFFLDFKKKYSSS